ncbi:hypothetical protein [Rhodococcus globerulus]|uniref:hypothetical protein n=1 Tax=Rhodococcus globerulus TaxID=33008 RepID=UPI003016E97C
MTKIKIAVSAENLSGAHIDEIVVFPWKFKSGVEATVRGQLRQIYHTSAEAVVNLCGIDELTGDLSEFVLDRATRIEIEA